LKLSEEELADENKDDIPEPARKPVSIFKLDNMENKEDIPEPAPEAVSIFEVDNMKNIEAKTGD